MSKPQLVSQAPVVLEDDWGDEDDEMELLMATSQMESQVLGAAVPDEEDLLAMTALMGEDFGEDEWEEEMASQQQERLNQTATLFPDSCDFNFKAPAPPTQDPSRREEEKLKKLNQKFQGEAAFLRAELKKREQEVEVERVGRRQLEAEAQERLEREQKAREEEVARVKTERLFFLQEMQQLKERLQQQATEKEESRTPEVRRGKSKGYKEEREFYETKPRRLATVETQTVSGAKSRVGRLRRSTTVGEVGVRSLCRVAPLEAGDQSRVLLVTSPVLLRAEVTAIVARQLVALKAGQGEVAPRLKVLQSSLAACPRMVSVEQRTGVTEVCSDLLSSLIKSKESILLPDIMELLCTAWAPALQDLDITEYVLSLLAELLSFARCLLDSPRTVQLLLRLVGRVGEAEEQARLLCQGQDDCFVTSLASLLIRAGAGSSEVQEAAARALSHWIIAASSLSQKPLYLGTSCLSCPGALLAAATHLTKLQVLRLLALPEEEAGRRAVVALVGDCVTALSRQQEVLRWSPGGEDTAWLGLLNTNARVQRDYMWSMERATGLEEELGEEVGWRLRELVLEQQDTDSEAMER